MAARSIIHKFVRLFDKSVPEDLAEYVFVYHFIPHDLYTSGTYLFSESNSPTSFFPSPQQVVATDLATLRTAGLSGRKAEYSQ